jgi:hypothetical protein
LSVPVLSWLFIAVERKPPSHEAKPLHGQVPTLVRAAVLPRPSSPDTTRFSQSPTDPTLRANPFPEVTDLICRLPLPTLFYRLEAVNLGDLLRIWVRPGTRINHALGFSRTTSKAHRNTATAAFYRANNPISGNPIPGSSRL